MARPEHTTEPGLPPGWYLLNADGDRVVLQLFHVKRIGPVHLPVDNPSMEYAPYDSFDEFVEYVLEWVDDHIYADPSETSRPLPWWERLYQRTTAWLRTPDPAS